MANRSMTGRCLCGAVTFSAEDVEPHIHACHCGMCRRWSGGPGMAVSVGSISFTGADELRTYDSSEWAERGFCGVCGSNLFYRLKEQDRYVVWNGALDDPTDFELTGEIYIDEKPSSYDFAGDHPRLTGQEFLKSVGMA